MSLATDRLRLARAPGIGAVTVRRLLERFGTATAAIAALPEMAARAGRPPPVVPTAQDVQRELDGLEAIGARLLFVGAPGYPALLALLDDPPPALAVMGDVSLLDRPMVAVIGSRNASANGCILAARLAEQLAQAGLGVVSGLARGIDAAAHAGALRAGVTIACIAGGLDRPYPPENAALQARIAEHGCVLAEAPLGTAPMARHFPKRNRVIAGLSLGVVVVEAAMRSGSLITARLALEAGREIFAVPGSPLDPRAEGTNALIRNGAHLTAVAADILDNLPDHPHRQGLARDPLFARPGRPEPPPAEVEERQIALETPETALAAVTGLLGITPTLVDDLVRRCQLSAPEVRAALLDLELAGRVETLPGNRVALLARRD